MNENLHVVRRGAWCEEHHVYVQHRNYAAMKQEGSDLARYKFSIMAIVNRHVEERWVYTTMVLLFLLVGGCQQEENVEPIHQREGPPVRVAPVTIKEIQHSVPLVGTVEPWKRSIIASEIAGLVKEFPLNEGDTVQEGELLARLRTDTIDIRIKEALARRGEWVARYRKAKFRLNRTQALLRTGTASRQEFEDDEAEELALRERLAQLVSQIREYQDQLRMSNILAPFSGSIIKEHTEVGQWVDEGGPVVEMVDLSRVQVEIPLPERYVNGVKRGDSVAVSVDALPSMQMTGTIFSIVAQANPETRTFPVKIEIPNPEWQMKAGMFARITLSAGLPYQATLVPKDAGRFSRRSGVCHGRKRRGRDSGSYSVRSTRRSLYRRHE